jgi:hypothetical protein
MLTIKKCDKSYLQCQSCETKENVKNISIAHEDSTGTVSIRLCLNCIAELTRQVITGEIKEG